MERREPAPRSSKTVDKNARSGWFGAVRPGSWLRWCREGVSGSKGFGICNGVGRNPGQLDLVCYSPWGEWVWWRGVRSGAVWWRVAGPRTRPTSPAKDGDSGLVGRAAEREGERGQSAPDRSRSGRREGCKRGRKGPRRLEERSRVARPVAVRPWGGDREALGGEEAVKPWGEVVRPWGGGREAWGGGCRREGWVRFVARG